MTSISLVPVQHPQVQSKHKLERHIVNAGVTAAGVGALYAGLSINPKRGSKFAHVMDKVLNSVTDKIADKITIFDKPLKRFMDGVRNADPTDFRAFKGGLLMVASVVALTSAFIARGIYNAGKINADK